MATVKELRKIMEKSAKTVKTEDGKPFKPVDYSHCMSADCSYNFLFGGRSNAKTTGALAECLYHYAETGRPFAYFRRWPDEMKPANMSRLFDCFVRNGFISALTNGEYDKYLYRAKRWYFYRVDDDGNRVVAKEPFCLGFVLSVDSEFAKGNDFVEVDYILFDEFISERGRYCGGNTEPKLFFALAMTIARYRNKCKFFMCANTNAGGARYSPYFNWFGLKEVKKMKPGDEVIYKMGKDGKCRIYVYFTDAKASGGISEELFCFDNPYLRASIGADGWEFDDYKSPPVDYRPCEVLGKAFIDFDDEFFLCEVVCVDTLTFLSFRPTRKDRFKDDGYSPVYSFEITAKPNWNTNIFRARNRMEEIIVELIRQEKCFYVTPDVGDTINAFFNACNEK